MKLLVTGLVMLAAAACASSNDRDPRATLCDPGSNIFCRCVGGEAGTKPCNAAGDGFLACEPCLDRMDNGGATSGGAGTGVAGSSSGSATSGSATSTGSGGAGPGATTTAGAGGAGDRPLLAACGDDGQCASGKCRFGYCTIDCAVVSDCPYPSSECVRFDASLTVCMPTCETVGDCAEYNAPPSQCGYTTAVDNWGVTTCAHWGERHRLWPLGTECDPLDHPACHLGYGDRATVCVEQGVCASGCYLQAHCPAGTTCSGQAGSLGNCQ